MLVICLLWRPPLCSIPYSSYSSSRPFIFSISSKPSSSSRFYSSYSSSIPIGIIHTPHSSNAPCVLLSCAKVLLFLYACK